MGTPPEVLKIDGLGVGKRGCRETLFLQIGHHPEPIGVKVLYALSAGATRNLERYEEKSRGAMTDEWLVLVPWSVIDG